jgi:hypothetical protein
MPLETPGSPIRVFVDSHMQVDGIAITMALRYSQEEVYVLRVQEGGWTTREEVDPMTNVPPTLKLTDDFGRALLEALLRYYNGSEDARTTRADLLHERERVDKLISMYGMLATTATERD